MHKCINAVCLHSLLLFDFEHVQRSVFVSCWKYILQYIVFAVKSREALQNVRNTENICCLQKSFAFELDFLLRTFLQCWCATVKNEEWPFQKGHSILSWFWQISWQENPLKVTNSFFLTKTTIQVDRGISWITLLRYSSPQGFKKVNG